MNDTAQQPGPGADDDSAADGTDGRLAAYVASTQTALDVLALAALWLCVVPPSDFSTAHNARTITLTIRFERHAPRSNIYTLGESLW
jgi:hypothetical protein